MENNKVDKRKQSSKANIQKALEKRRQLCEERKKRESMFDYSSSDSSDSEGEVIYIAPKKKNKTKKPQREEKYNDFKYKEKDNEIELLKKNIEELRIELNNKTQPVQSGGNNILKDTQKRAIYKILDFD